MNVGEGVLKENVSMFKPRINLLYYLNITKTSYHSGLFIKVITLHTLCQTIFTKKNMREREQPIFF